MDEEISLQEKSSGDPHEPEWQSSLLQKERSLINSIVSIRQLGVEEDLTTSHHQKLSLEWRLAIVTASCYVQFMLIGTCYSTGYYFVTFENEFKS